MSDNKQIIIIFDTIMLKHVDQIINVIINVSVNNHSSDISKLINPNTLELMVMVEPPLLTSLAVLINNDFIQSNQLSNYAFRSIQFHITINTNLPYSHLKRLLESSDVANTGSGIVQTNIFTNYFKFHSSSSIRMVFTMVNIQYLRYLNIDYSSNLQEFFGTMIESPVILQLFPNIFYFFIQPNNDDLEVTSPPTFQKFNVSPYFIDNFGRALTGFIVLSLFAIIFKILSIYVDKGYFSSYVSAMIIYGKNVFIWNIFLSFFFSLFSRYILSLGLQLKVISWNTPFQTASSIFAIVFSIFLLLPLFTAYVSVLVLKIRQITPLVNNLQEFIEINPLEKFAVIFQDFHFTEPIQVFYITIMLIRSITIYTMMILAINSPLIQILTIELWNLLFLIYLIKYKPIRLQKDLIVTILNETLLFITTNFMFAFAIMDMFKYYNNDVRDLMGWIVIGFITTMTIMNAISSIYDAIRAIKQFILWIIRFAKKFRDNNKVTPEEKMEARNTIDVENQSIKDSQEFENIELKNLELSSHNNSFSEHFKISKGEKNNNKENSQKLKTFRTQIRRKEVLNMSYLQNIDVDLDVGVIKSKHDIQTNLRKMHTIRSLMINDENDLMKRSIEKKLYSLKNTSFVSGNNDLNISKEREDSSLPGSLSSSDFFIKNDSEIRTKRQLMHIKPVAHMRKSNNSSLNDSAIIEEFEESTPMPKS